MTKLDMCDGRSSHDPGDKAINALIDVCFNQYRPGKHNCIVVTRRRFRDLFQLTYWCICINCSEFISGPYDNKDTAWQPANA